MIQAQTSSLDLILCDPASHFAVHLYVAIDQLLAHIDRMSAYGGEPLDRFYQRYPFLAAYGAELCRYMPENLDWVHRAELWRSQILAWEEGTGTHLPLRALGSHLGLTFEARLAFVLTGLVEEDSRFGTFLSELQAPLNTRRPTLEFLGQVLGGGAGRIGVPDPWGLCGPLLESGLVETANPEAPRSEWTLRVPALLWDAARGRGDPPSETGLRLIPTGRLPSIDDLLFPADLLGRLARLPALVASGMVRLILLRSDPGTEALDVMGAIARGLGRGVLSLPSGSNDRERTWPALAPWCAMTGAMPVIAYDLSPGETAKLPALGGYGGPVGVLQGREGGLSDRALDQVITLELDPPDLELRRRHWRRALNGHTCEDLDRVAETFRLSGAYIRQVAQIALAQAGLNGSDRVGLAEVREAARALNRQHLDTLAARLEAKGRWEDLVVSEATRVKLIELGRRCACRERIQGHLGPAFEGSAQRGVRALLTGVSGTGKTLAARILAAELGMDIFRVDLAAVVNKYIGETEKNLHQVLTQAEALDVILLLDEGDALLGSRTEVKSANDRYANLETNFLLQRLEQYQGIVLVTTNLGENIDQAFKRRMDVVVPFFAPQVQERRGILSLHLPTLQGLSPEYLDEVALRCQLTGGQLRNAVTHAALLALEESAPIEDRHLETALRAEYRKAGGVYPIRRQPEGFVERPGRLQSFVAALRDD
ncbi:ATP-binding protein [Halochromatium glycolicum]|uniref:AAA+ ATPase domain-containing protein n=1 Tax=Halochromatium glycolicum TaxID=85075 RepID=A0AAJ0U3Q0_9GAMM|nr:ATP-binding protein [Halochromatium glycolicum]MBK1704715.1 hypothetical protein [Halochromatium glycolicum]